MKSNRNWCALTVAGALIHGAASAAPLDLRQSFLNPSPDANDLFGQSVSLSGGIALVGASADGTTGSGSGRAYVFDAATGALLRTLENPSPGPLANDNFGVSVSLSGTKALVGAQNDDTSGTNAGSAYLFDITTGNLSRTFPNPGPAPVASDSFGLAVAVSGNRALISAIGDDTGASNSGAAYYFDATTGALLRTFTNPTPVASDSFGFSVALSATQALIGATGDDTGAMNAGAAYLFDTATGALLYTFTNPTPGLNDMFGTSIALSATRALIGASQDDDAAGFNEGAAYLYDLATGLLLQTLRIPNPVGNSEFLGQSVALSGDFALVGAGFRNRGVPIAQQGLGAAFLFDAKTGAFLQEIVDTVPNINDRFGFAVALDGNEALIGAQTNLVAGVQSGQVFYYSTGAAVPEPGSIAVWGCLASLCGVGAVVRCKLRALKEKRSEIQGDKWGFRTMSGQKPF